MPAQPDAGPARPRPRVRAALLTATILVLAVAIPVQASMTKTRVLFRDGQILIVEQSVGNQQFSYQWVENDPRRHAAEGTTLYYRIDETEPPPGISFADTEAAIEAAVDTFGREACAQNFRLVRVDEGLNEDLGVIQNRLGYGGSTTPRADITFAGWVPASFFPDAGVGQAFGVALPIVWDASDDSFAYGVEVWDPSRAFVDANGDGKHDMFATEVYFSYDWQYVLDNPELANTLFYIDVQTIVTHELGHALGMDHFGASTVVLDDGGNFIDILVNQNSSPLMNTNSYLQKRELSGSDRGSFCGIYGNWGKGPR
jgi:hypothetical protein